MAKPKGFKTIRLFDKTLALATELVDNFAKQGYKSSWTSVVNTSVQLMHSALIDENFTLVSRAELDKTRAYDIGTSIAAVLGALASAKMNMLGCELSYLPAVDAICIRLPDVPDVLIHAGGANPAAIANVITDQLRSRGYIQDDGAVFVDMDQILGAPVREGN